MEKKMNRSGKHTPDPAQALEILSQASSQYRGSLAEHQTIQSALRVLSELILSLEIQNARDEEAQEQGVTDESETQEQQTQQAASVKEIRS